MKRTLVAALVSLSLGANAAGWDDLRISGFGSVGIGQSDNAVGYAGYTDEKVDWEQETLAGLQFDFRINDRAKFVTQIVSNSRYDYAPKIEMAYASYSFESFTARAGKLRLPLFFYSDYTDVGYAYPMIRPSQELYENLVLKGYTGADLLIPVEFENSTLLFQPVVGIGEIDEDDSVFGEVDLDGMYGLSAQWIYEDLMLRGSYFAAEANPTCTVTDPTSKTDACTVAHGIVAGQDGQFISLGAQYDNGDLLANIEAADVQLEGQFYDYRSVTGLLGYRVGKFTPYLAAGWVETTDNEERTGSPLALSMSYERMSYSVGSRWDFTKNMALKFDVTYVDYKETSGGFTSNVPQVSGNEYEDSSLVYSARLDFVF
ncbi:outer membrane protein [Vibrio astriarenae]|uniref:outer membrane protein n=1 Tax=Vibrio astriarenae TaxID=1481923 RepID=UPI00373666F4